MDVAMILDVVTKAGPYALFALAFYAWKIEREERIATQKSFVTLITDGLKATNETTNALRELRQSLFGYISHERADG